MIAPSWRLSYDPVSTGADGRRVPFNNNTIPKNRIHPIAETMRSVSAEPNIPGRDPWLEPNFETYYPNTTNIDTLTLKGDHVFSESDNVTGRFTRSRRNYKLFGGRYGYPPPGATDAGGTGR